MSSTRTRIGVLGGIFAAALVAIVVHLWFLMVQQHETWAGRSLQNRWAFRAVPSQRGTLRDRFGRPLASDAPTAELAVLYERFRMSHPVGAAVHGAILWSAQQAGREGTTFDYGAGVRGAVAAANELLAIPVPALGPRALPKHVGGPLRAAVATMLAHASGWPRSRVFRALREAAASGTAGSVGDVLPLGRAAVLAAFTGAYDALCELDLRLRAHADDRRQRLALPASDQPGLLGTLELLRRASLAGARSQWEQDGVVQEGSRLESVLRTFAADVPFVIAAEVRIGASRWPGIEVAPCLTRESHVAPDSSLRVLLGNVADLDVAIPDARWIDRHLAEELPDDWLDELVPAGVVDDDEALTVWRQRARLRYEDELRRRERRGVTGVEAAFDDVLMGRLGLRFVEHDSTRREHLLWSHLQVEAGQDVALTLDLDLQQVAERAVRIAWQQQSSRYDDPDERKKVEAAIAVLDAHTGDLLAYAGAPIVSAAARDLPGVVWQGNGALGSVVKSFLLLEQLQSEAMGRPHRPLADLADCNGKFVFGDTLLGCGDEHWSQGRDPVQALAESCNLFFYQVGIGLGPEGIARALRRFGLLEPAGPQDPFAACWQPSIPGFAAARPRADTAQTIVPRRAIGYGVEASPVHVARAYAALATGSLPTVGLRLSEPRPRVPFTDVVGELEVVREGLRAAVATGTARRLRTLEQLGVCGKTGTAQIRVTGQNNAWFAGYLPQPSLGGQQLCCCAVVYSVQDKVHGGDAAGQIVVDVLDAVRDDPTLRARYLPPGAGR